MEVKEIIRILLAGKLSNNSPFLNVRGFTLLELIVALFLVLLIAGLTTPYLLSTLDRTKGGASVKKVATLFRAARNKAIAEKVPYSFNASIENNKYWLINMETEEISDVHELDNTMKITEFSDGEEIITDGVFNIFFYPQGNTSGGTLLLTSRREQAINYRLILDPITGKPYVEQKTE